MESVTPYDPERQVVTECLDQHASGRICCLSPGHSGHHQDAVGIHWARVLTDDTTVGVMIALASQPRVPASPVRQALDRSVIAQSIAGLLWLQYCDERQRTDLAALTDVDRAVQQRMRELVEATMVRALDEIPQAVRR